MHLFWHIGRYMRGEDSRRWRLIKPSVVLMYEGLSVFERFGHRVLTRVNQEHHLIKCLTADSSVQLKS